MSRVCIDEEENPWKKLDDGTVETVLAGLPTIDIVRCKLVCKRWRAIISSPTFQVASNQLIDRRPWFLMCSAEGSCFSSTTSAGGLVYDAEVSCWRKINLPIPTTFIYPKTTIVSSAGLMCFSSEFNHLIVCNPLTGSKHWLPWLGSLGTPWNIRGVAMHASAASNYKVFVAFVSSSILRMKVFSSLDKKPSWRELPMMKKLTVDESATWPVESIGIENPTPTKGIRGVTTIGNEGQILVHFLTLTGILVSFDTRSDTILMSPSFAPPSTYFKAELVECSGRVFVVALFCYGNICVWEFDYEAIEWKRKSVPVQPFYEVRCANEINCAGYGNYIMICLNNFDLYVNVVMMYHIRENTCHVLPSLNNGKEPPTIDYSNSNRLLWPYSFKPDFEDKV